MCQAAICLILNTNGCHGSTSIGDGIRDEKKHFWNFGQCSSNIESLESLKSISYFMLIPADVNPILADGDPCTPKLPGMES